MSTIRETIRLMEAWASEEYGIILDDPTGIKNPEEWVREIAAEYAQAKVEEGGYGHGADRSEAMKRARLIVRAVNHHDALVAVAREYLTLLESDYTGSPFPRCWVGPGIEAGPKVEALLAKIGEEAKA